MAERITDLITEDDVLVPLQSTSKEELLDELTRFLTGRIGRNDLVEPILKGIWEREREISTGIGRGIAIPHAEIDEEIDPAAAIGISPGGAEFEALDSQPVHIVFLLICSKRNQEVRLGVLSSLSHLFGERSVRQALRKATSSDEVVKVIRESERKD
jgi:PTS system fructose-specific IIC component